MTKITIVMVSVIKMDLRMRSDVGFKKGYDHHLVRFRERDKGELLVDLNPKRK